MVPSSCRSLVGKHFFPQKPTRLWSSTRCAIIHSITVPKLPDRNVRPFSQRSKPRRDQTAKKRAFKNKRAPRRNVDKDIDSAQLQDVFKFQYAVSSDDIEEILRLYPQLLIEGLLTESDVPAIAQKLHSALRLKPAHLTSDQVLLEFDLFAEKYISGALLPSSKAIVHILGFYRDAHLWEQGITFWNWAVGRQQNFLSMPAYGAAIELLAGAGYGLEVCEELYIKAIKTHLIGFNEYLLTPGSVLSRPEEPTLAKGLSMNLVQGITFARLRSGDWRSAYLGLDMALKLYPNMIPGYFMAMFINFRPLSETLRIFKVLSRSANKIPATATIQLLEHATVMRPIAKVGAQPLYDLRSIILHLMISRAPVEQVHFHTFHKALMKFVTQLKLAEGEELKEATSLLRRAHEVSLGVFSRFGLSPCAYIYRMTLKAALRLGDATLQTQQIEKLLETDDTIKLPDVASWIDDLLTRKDSLILESFWRLLREKIPSVISTFEAWQLLADASKRSRQPGIFQNLLLSDPTLSKEDVKVLSESFPVDTEHEAKTTALSTPAKSINPPALTNKILKVKRYLESIENISALPLDSPAKLKSELMKESSMIYPLKWYERLYQDLHIRPLYEGEATVPQSKESIVPLPVQDANSSTADDELRFETLNESTIKIRDKLETIETGFTYSSIRFQNWKDMTELMLEAHAFEDQVAKSTDNERINSSRPRSLKGLEMGINREAFLLQQHEIRSIGIRQQKMRLDSEEKWRSEVLRLRQINSSMISNTMVDQEY